VRLCGGRGEIKTVFKKQTTPAAIRTSRGLALGNSNTQKHLDIYVVKMYI
jgi:hypothetical protein